MILAIKRKKTGEFVAWTDYRQYPPRSMTDSEMPPILFSDNRVETEIKVRRINLKYYEIVPVKIVEVTP